MGSMKVEKFGGMLPAWDDRNIPDDQATFTQNAYLYSGAAFGWRQPKELRALANSAAKFAYRVPTQTQGIANANLVFTGTPNSGDTVTLGEITYKFTATPVNPFDVLLSGTTQQTVEALFLATNFGSFDSTIIGANTPANPAIASAAPVLGNPYVFVPGTSTPSGNSVLLIPVTPTGTMQLTDVNMLVQGSNGAARFKGVVYENVNQINSTGTAYINIPSSLLATGAEVTGCTAGQVVTSHMAIPVTLIGGTVYWIGFVLDTGVPIQLATSGTQAVSSANVYTNGPLNPFQTTVISGTTTGGTTVGSLLATYNTNQPNWNIWGSMQTISTTDAENTIGTTQIGGVGSFYNFINFEAPAFGASFNSTPLGTVSGAFAWLKDVASFADVTGTFVGGANQIADTTITGLSTWLEFLDQDTNVLRTPVVDDTFQRFYFASPSLPPQYNTYDRIASGKAAFYLGVPAPPIAPTLSIISGSGGNPTQIGFPGSKTTPYGPFLLPYGNAFLVLYPVQSSIGVTLNDIGLMLTSIAAEDSVAFSPIVFADVSATSGPGGATNAPGDLIALGAEIQIDGASFLGNGGTDVLPFAMIAPFLEPPGLTAGTQYWIGALFSAIGFAVLGGVGSTSSVTFGQADTYKQGLSALMGTPVAFPTDPGTGSMAAPSGMTVFNDLQLWGDLAIGTTGEAQEETRAYVYTWVTAYGEEGPPSPPALLDAYDNATWVVGMQPPLAQDLGTLRNIVQTNIYRTMASVQGGTVFFLVGTLGATATTFVDNVTDDVAATNLILPSTTWFGPPTTLAGLVSMPNGMMAGFRGNEVWFCEPFRPHAWPAGYVMTTDYPIVGLGVVGTSLVACTETTPNVFIGVSPSVMSQVRVPLPEPCTSRGGILSTDSGVYYPSVNGLIKVAGGGFANNLTQAWITREKWDQYTPQKFLRATKNVSTYFAFGTTGVTNGQPDASLAQEGFTIELSEIADQQSFTLWPQVGGHRIGFGTLGSPNGTNIDNVLCDPWSGVTLLVAGGNVLYYDFTDPAPAITKYLWRSKKFQGPFRENYAAYRVWFDIPPGGPQTPPATRTTVPFTAHPPKVAALAYKPGMFGVVRIIADGFYVTERELRVSTELMRIASEQKYTTWQIEIEGVVSVSNVKFATTVKELAAAGGKQHG